MHGDFSYFGMATEAFTGNFSAANVRQITSVYLNGKHSFEGALKSLDLDQDQTHVISTKYTVSLAFFP